MSRAGWVATAVGLLLLTSLGVVTSAPAVAEDDLFTNHRVVDAPGSTSWATVVSETHASLATEPDWQLYTGGRLDDHVRVELVHGGYDFSFRFAPPLGETLAPGEYRGTTSDPDVGRAGFDLRTPGYGCGASTGSFTVRDVADDLTRLWITYDYRCGSGPAITGELRLNQPRAPGFDVAPTRAGWPEEPVGEPGRPVPVTLLNPSSTPLDVSSVEVTAGRSDFTLVHDTCGQVAAGGFCRAHVQFQPSRTGDREGTLTFRTSRGDRTMPLAGSATPPTGEPAPPRPVPVHAEQPGAGDALLTRWSQEADDDAWVGNPGGPVQFGPSHVEDAFGHDTWFRFEAAIGAPSNGYELYLRTNDDHLLLAGTTVTPVRTTYPDGPYDTGALEVRGMSRGCGGIADRSFRIFQTTYALDGSLTGIALSYRFRCLTGSYDGETRGSIAWNATCVPGMPGGPDEDRCVPVDLRPRTRLDLATARTSPSRVRVSGRLAPAATSGRVVLERRVPGQARWTVVRRVTTGPASRWSAVLTRPRGYYRAQFAGSPALRPSTSRVARIGMS